MRGGYRVPDVLDHGARVIGDVKNVRYLSRTKQMRDYMAYARENKYTFVLFINEGAEMSKPLLRELSELSNEVEVLIHPLKVPS